MRTVFVLVFTLGLAGCATTSELSQIYVGMHTEQVREIVGSPVRIQRGRQPGCDYEKWEYYGLHNFIEFCNGRVYNWYQGGF